MNALWNHQCFFFIYIIQLSISDFFVAREGKEGLKQYLDKVIDADVHKVLINMSWHALHTAAVLEKNASVVKYLLDNGGNVDEQSPNEERKLFHLLKWLKLKIEKIVARL